jgi:hypothetical protein
LSDCNLIITFVQSELHILSIITTILQQYSEDELRKKYNITKDIFKTYDLMFGKTYSKTSDYIKSYRASGEGDSFKIFATVKAALYKFLNEEKIVFDILYFECT